MSGANQGGLPNYFRQAKNADYIDKYNPQRPAACVDPSTLALARTIAEAVRLARPVVSLPPHITMPWRGRPWMREARFILDGSNNATIALGAAAAGTAEAITVVSEITSFTTEAGNNPGRFTVPQGQILVVRSWAAQCDLGGYNQNANTGTPLVSFVLDFSGERTLFASGLQGNIGTLENPFDVSYIAMPGTVVGVLAFSADTTMWHLIETAMTGYLVQSSDIDDSINAMLENDR